MKGFFDITDVRDFLIIGIALMGLSPFLTDLVNIATGSMGGIEVLLITAIPLVLFLQWLGLLFSPNGSNSSRDTATR